MSNRKRKIIDLVVGEGEDVRGAEERPDDERGLPQARLPRVGVERRADARGRVVEEARSHGANE